MTYRLKRFQKEGIIGKISNGEYILTAHGLRFTDSLNLGKFVPRDFPRPVTLLVCRRGDDWLLYERFMHPLKNMTGLPHINVKPNIGIITSAEQRLLDLAGIKVKLIFRGSGYLTFHNSNNELEVYNQVNILENVTQPKGKLIAMPEPELGRYFWQSKPNFSESKYLPSLQDIAKLLDDNPQQLVFFEKTYKLPNS